MQIESLPTRSNDEQPLQNILSISTAGRNRYLLHFNSHHSLLQWTAGIRLSMFEHSTLQEAYTGALIAGKGKTVNNINVIMDRAKFKTEAWVRVRFGAGVPWRRCWCVISPPDEKEYQKLHKEMRKKSPYDHGKMPVLKGDVKFYDTKKDGKKQKKSKPIASITDAFSCYAIYPQAKSLIDASTLIKIEGSITIHSEPPSSTEGFIFLMPEVPPAVTGFEMLLRFLFPTWDTFGLYGRPGRLVASVLDPRSLMFAMPKHRRYGYLEILDVTSLILTEGSTSWTERDWKKKLKELTGQRMQTIADTPPPPGRSASRNSKRMSSGPSPPNGGTRARVGFSEAAPGVRTSRSFSTGTPGPRTDSAPPGERIRAPNSIADLKGHARNNSDTGLRPNGLDGLAPHLNDERNAGSIPSRGQTPVRFANELAPTPERVSSEDDYSGPTLPIHELQNMQVLTTPEPVQAPPGFAHARTARPERPERAYHNAELRRATSRLSMATLSQLGVALDTNTDPALMEANAGRDSGENNATPTSGRTDPQAQAVHTNANAYPVGMYANVNGSRQALTPANNTTPQRLPPQETSFEQNRSRSPMTQAPGQSGPQGGGQRPQGTNAYGPGGPAGRGQHPTGGQGGYGGRGGAPTPPPHGPQGSRGPPPPGHGRGRGMPPPGPYGEERRPSPGPRGAPNPNAYQSYQAVGDNNGPPPNSSKTPPPGAQRKPLPALQTRSSPSIQRKPLPPRNDSLQSTRSSVSSPSNYRDPILDEAAFQLMDSPEAARHDDDYGSQQQRQRQMTMRSEASSCYDDTASTASPDYASTRKSSETQESMERPRAGVLKTVGNKAPDSASHPDMPDMSFGPTLNLAHPRNQTRGPWAPPNPPAIQPDRPYSPGGARKPTLMTATANMTPSAGEISRVSQISEISHSRTESDDTLRRRSVAWQPGVAIGGGRDERALSPEEFVQQRAAAAAANAPYAHRRTPSGNALAQAGSPPLKRTGSQDYLTKRHSRATSAELLQRRSSQDSTYLLGANGTGAVGSTLSAREQEQVARATGTPLIGLATSNGPGPHYQAPGLVGAIDAREREKQQMKGYNSQTVQHAINQRQQQAQYAQQQQQFAQSQMYGSQNMSAGNLSNMGHMGMGPPPPSTYGGSMGMQPMAVGRGSGFSSPGPSRAATLSPPPVGLPGGMAPQPMPQRAQSPGPRFKSPPPMHGVAQPYAAQSPGFGQPSPGLGGPSPGFGGPSPGYGQPSPGFGGPSPGYGAPMRMNSPGPGAGPMRMASPGPGAGPMRMASPGPGAGPMRMASPGPGVGPMRMASPGPGMGPMRMASPGPGMQQMRTASPGPGMQQLRTASPGVGRLPGSPGPGQTFGRQVQVPPPGHFAPMQPGTPGTPRGQAQFNHGQAF